ncbi:SDR family oxidoreductase [Promicromonospora sp. NPDC090134]|uniref:SDR family oxidoreductase n=1 Tax=Promicromonospora sp. NPDC090134 TaxID=3364408 RepID=UPI00380ECF76
MSNKVAVVSGGTAGIGAAVVERLRGAGYSVVTGSRSAVPEKSDDLTVVRADLGTGQGVEALAMAALERGRVDAVVNNVGRFDHRASFLDITDEQWRESFAVNVLSAVRLTRALLPALLEQGGAIVNVSSINARLPFPNVVDYSAYKAALTNLTTSLSEEFARRGVRVNAVSPGPVRTSSLSAVATASGITRDRTLDEGVPAKMGVTLDRVGEAHEVAEAVAFFLSPHAQWITGSDLVVDGGTIKTV